MIDGPPMMWRLGRAVVLGSAMLTAVATGRRGDKTAGRCCRLRSRPKRANFVFPYNHTLVYSLVRCCMQGKVPG